MTKRYFAMNDDVHVKGRWHLVDPTGSDGADLSGVFRRGQPASVAAPVTLWHSKFARRGKPVDYSEIDDQIVPVVHVRVAELLKELAPTDIELVPVTIDGCPAQYHIVNVVAVRRCIDEGASREIMKYTEAERAVWPDRVGEYMYVGGLKIDKSKVGDAKVFRTWGWGSIIVAESIKNAFEAAQVTGAKFVEV